MFGCSLKCLTSVLCNCINSLHLIQLKGSLLFWNTNEYPRPCFWIKKRWTWKIRQLRLWLSKCLVACLARVKVQLLVVVVSHHVLVHSHVTVHSIFLINSSALTTTLMYPSSLGLIRNMAILDTSHRVITPNPPLNFRAPGDTMPAPSRAFRARRNRTDP